MHILFLECSPTDTDGLVAELWEHGTTGIVESDLPAGAHSLQAFFDEPFDASFWSSFAPRWEPAPDRDWVEIAQAQWEPVLVGSRFFLVPEWRSDPAPAGRIRLEMHPAQACGTGWGPATQLALEALERTVTAGMAVLDLGTGSGILSVAAARLGARAVFACDIDPEAAAEAGQRFTREQLNVGLFAGSLRAVRDHAVDLVVANINAEVLVELAGEIRRVLAPDGTAALTGFPDRHLERVRQAFGGPGEVLERGEWRAFVHSPR